MRAPSPEQATHAQIHVALRTLLAAGALLLPACSPAHQANANASPVADVPSSTPPKPCEVPVCSPSPTPSETETEPSQAPTTPSPSHGPTRKAKPLGFACNWMDVDGQRQPLVSEDDVIVRVDGRCREPDPLAPINIHASPDLKGPVVDTVENDDELVAKCAMRGDTRFIDARGPRSASRTVLWVETPHGKKGFVSELTVGYVDDTQLRINGTLPTCDFGS